MSGKKTEMLKPGEDPNNFNAGVEETTKAVKQVETVEVQPANTQPVGQRSMTITEMLEKAQVQLDKHGLPMPKDAVGEFQMSRVLFQGKAFPNWVKSVEQAFAVCQFLRGVGLQPMVGIQHTCEVNGRISLWGEGPMAAVMASGKLKSIDEYVIDKDYKRINVENKNLDAEMFSVVCRMERTDGRVVEHAFTKMDAARVEHGIDAIWKKWPRIMWKRKARAEVIKDLFADVIGGAGIAEYDFHTAPDLLPQREAGKMSAKEKLEARYGKGLEVSQGGEANALPDLSGGTAANSDRSMPCEDVREQSVGCVVQHNSDVPRSS